MERDIRLVLPKVAAFKKVLANIVWKAFAIDMSDNVTRLDWVVGARCRRGHDASNKKVVPITNT